MVHVSGWSAYASNTWGRPGIAFKESRKSRKDLNNYLVTLMLVVMGTSTGDRLYVKAGSLAKVANLKEALILTC